MNRYLLFAGDRYYPAGGWNDLKGSFATLEEALASMRPPKESTDEDLEFWHYHDWFHVVDAMTGKIVYSDIDLPV